MGIKPFIEIIYPTLKNTSILHIGGWTLTFVICSFNPACSEKPIILSLLLSEEPLFFTVLAYILVLQIELYIMCSLKPGFFCWVVLKDQRDCKRSGLNKISSREGNPQVSKWGMVGRRIRKGSFGKADLSGAKWFWTLDKGFRFYSSGRTTA